jgi:hypothetical protein
MTTGRDYDMTLVIIFFGLLLAVTELTFQSLIGFPVQILNFFGSLLSYGVLAGIVLLLAWIVGD